LCFLWILFMEWRHSKISSFLLVYLFCGLPLFISSSRICTLSYFLTFPLIMLSDKKENSLKYVFSIFLFIIMIYFIIDLDRELGHTVYRLTNFVLNFDTVAFIDDLRGRQMDVALQLIKDNWFFGVGPGRSTLFTRGNLEIHNQFLYTFAEYGIIGIGLLILCIGLFIFKIIRLHQSTNYDKIIFLSILILFLAPNLFGIFLTQRWSWVFIAYFWYFLDSFNERYAEAN
jgi:O-antigen ligase